MTSRKPIAAMVAILLLVGAVVGFTSNPANAAPPTTDSFSAAQFSAQWLISQADPSGAIGGNTATPAVYNNTAQAVLSLSAARQGEATFDAAVTWLEANAATQVPLDGTASPGLIGYLLLVANAADVDPTDFGGVNLVATLTATLQPNGLYGSADATYDGVYRQSIALMGLAAQGITVPGSAVDWLVDQQCGAVPAAATGGWQSYRADTAVPCSAPDASAFSGPDTNSTAAAVQALTLVNEVPAFDPIDYLATVQDPDSGGFAYVSGPGVDANSTALVIMALTLSGEDLAAAPWQRADGNPMTSLLSWQIGCGDSATVGAFQANWQPGADLMATIQGTWGAAMADLTTLGDPFLPRGVFVDVCENTNVFFADISHASRDGVTSGYPDGTFRPTNDVTRQAAAAYLYRFVDPDGFTPTGQTFADVPPSHPFYVAIEWAASEGIVTGYGDGTFRPDTVASRQATMAFLFRTTESVYTPTGQLFSDVAPSQPFYAEIEWAGSTGIADGYPDGTFRPVSATSRQAFVAFLYRVD